MAREQGPGPEEHENEGTVKIELTKEEFATLKKALALASWEQYDDDETARLSALHTKLFGE